MNANFDDPNITPAEFALPVGDLLREIKANADASEATKALRSQVMAALQSAVQASRKELFTALAAECGVSAMEFAAQEGLNDAIRMLHQAGVDCNGKPKAEMTPLIYAAINNHADTVDTLMDCGASLMPPGAYLNALSMAIANGHAGVDTVILNRTDDLSAVKHLGDSVLETIVTHGGAQFVPAVVAKGVSPHQLNRFDKTPLAIAAEHGRVDVMRALLAVGASPDAPPPVNDKPYNPFRVPAHEVPLALAAKYGHDEAVTLLIDVGADLSATDHQGMNAYDWARKSRHRSTMDLLRRAMKVAATTYDGHDLIDAAKEGDVAVIKRIVAGGVDVDFRDKVTTNSGWETTPGRTGLMWASLLGHVDAVQTLLDLGASPDKRQEIFGDDKSVWELAARANQVLILQILIDRTANPELMTAALLCAAEHGKLESISLLLEHGANVNGQGKKHETPLIAAANKGRADVIRLLLDHGANVELRTKGTFASPALHYALLGLNRAESVEDEQGKLVTRRIGDPVACVRLLIDAGADPNSIAKHGDYPLQYAVRNPEVTKMLIDAGADLSLTDKVYGDTALHFAALFSDMESARMLLDAGADHSSINKKGQTPLDIARERNKPEFVGLLERAGAVSGEDIPEGRAAREAVYAAENAEQYHREQAIAASEALKPDFSRYLSNKDYRDAVELLESITDTQHKTQENLPGLAVCRVDRAKAEDLVEARRGEFRELGCTLFCCGVHLVLDGDELLGILPTTDPLEVIAAIGTGGPNYDIFASDIVSELKELYVLVPFEVTQACYDTIRLQLAKPIPKGKVPKWATRLYKICPDLVDQGFLSLKKLRDHLATGTQLTLWWD